MKLFKCVYGGSFLFNTEKYVVCKNITEIPIKDGCSDLIAIRLIEKELLIIGEK